MRAVINAGWLLLAFVGGYLLRALTELDVPTSEPVAPTHVVQITPHAPQENLPPSAGAVTTSEPSVLPTLPAARPQSLTERDELTLRPKELDGGETFWMGHRRDDFGLEHGIEPEKVNIPANAQQPDVIQKFLAGTVWGWGSSPKHDNEWIIFLDDSTVYGSWGLRYRYTVDPDTLDVIWAEHRTQLSEGLHYIYTKGRNDRYGMLLKKVQGPDLDAFLKDVDGMHVIQEDEDSVPDE